MIRFESLTDKSKLDGQPELFLHIIPDKTNNTLNIIDSGIGMTKAVATPKQIRDLMKVKVDGLTNDEVKSHLQKYRLHTRRPATPVVTNGGENPQQLQFMVVEGIWVLSHDTTNNRVYALVAVQSSPSGERSRRRCKSPTTSSTHTTPSSSIIDSSRFV
ncbi:unnamed protein product [Arabidopsis lyrata]|uniref:Uncharacterized protein n=1 Tax=Arabidopsis lyrata subsp. lyrata TaxID=81972 RepID=D7L4G3_ARALL|nr:transcription factor HHO3 [Arabidopsis lyrata subsp. lyrata]EFH62239.1 hypothetical protein ARALYDRAFT_343166 [Arabidopsis lyrata subsp. lyrata]CAH8262341.1 unnamed protein product [Arabidopsis lyrata]|eukprot:XP_002885980.1 transcription factor HHO3 [Arabidopsis lyrata subsp. lyrata]